MTKFSTLKASCSAVALSALFFAAGTISAEAAACSPKIEGPIPVTATSKPYEAPSNPYAGTTPPAGEMEEEFFVSCDISGGHYKTLIHVTLPTDPARQSGIVIAEPWHPGDFWTIYDKARKYITRAGHVSVVIVGNPFILESYMKKEMPERYASLSLPGKGARSLGNTPAGETTEPEILGQVGGFIKAGLIPGIKARKVILGGMSTTGGVVRGYMLFEHKTSGAKSVYDGYFPQQAGGEPIADLDVPVVEMQGEHELVSAVERGRNKLTYRRPDGANYRLYEVAGSPHIATRMATQLSGPQPTNRIEPGIADCTGHPWTDFPTDMIFGVALDNLVQWVDKGVAAPHIARIQTAADGVTIQRDQYGNALGGMRTTYLDVPTATYHGNWGNYVTTPTGPSDPQAAKCDQIGWTAPLPAATIKTLYPTHADYVAKVDKASADLVRQGMLLQADVPELHNEAVKAAIP